MGEGTLRGQELASVMEQNAGLAEVVADGLGITTSQLKALGRQGKLTNEGTERPIEDDAAGQ